jgi:hypothetical protein
MMIMKNILFPTDFTTQSLSVLELYIKNNSTYKNTIVLFAAFEMPDSEQDVIGSDSKPHLQLMNEEFRKGCKRLKEKYAEKIGNMYYKYMYGNTQKLFKNHLEFNDIDEIFFPEAYTLTQPHQRFINPGSFINAATVKVIREVPAAPAQKSKQVVTQKRELTAAY